MNKRLNSISFPVLSFPYRVFYADTDAGGVVYYAQYLRMFERVRALYAEEFDLTLSEMAQRDCLFVCRRAEIDYISPARLDDTLSIAIHVSEQGKTFLTFSYEVTRKTNGEPPILIAQSITKMVCCREKNGQIRPQRVPEWVLERFATGPGEKKIETTPLDMPDTD